LCGNRISANGAQVFLFFLPKLFQRFCRNKRGANLMYQEPFPAILLSILQLPYVCDFAN
jgi:hypothetical protein